MSSKTSHQYKEARNNAISTVSRLIYSNKLPRLSKEYVSCVDCGCRASQYDHRNYNKPKEVVPVCSSCNYKRGQASYVEVPKVTKITLACIKCAYQWKPRLHGDPKCCPACKSYTWRQEPKMPKEYEPNQILEVTPEEEV